ncbi:hypothetical protein D9M69_490040 [compost metagenome]
MHKSIVRQPRIQLLVSRRNRVDQVEVTEVVALIGAQRLARRRQINPDFETVGALHQVKVAAIEVDDGLVAHLSVHAGEAGLHLRTENALHRMLGPRPQQQSGIADQLQFEQALQEPLARREHALEIVISRLNAVLFNRL